MVVNVRECDVQGVDVTSLTVRVSYTSRGDRDSLQTHLVYVQWW
jgi:hypothetical protein